MTPAEAIAMVEARKEEDDVSVILERQNTHRNEMSKS